MKYDVVKAFNTVNRRLAVSGEISSHEPIEPFTFEERVKSGFLQEHVDEVAKPAPQAPTSAALPQPLVTDK